ncbi:RNA-binding protein 34-like protein [Drosera capensis]
MIPQFSSALPQVSLKQETCLNVLSRQLGYIYLTDGSKIWDSYIEFEQAVLHILDESNCEVKEKQVRRIRSVFHRQLSVPLANMTSNLLAYKCWELEQGNSVNVNSREIDDITSHVDVAYKKAVDMYKSHAVMENEISNLQISDPEKLPVFKDICHCWLRFERAFWTLEDFDFAVEKKQISSKKGTREKRKHDSNSTYDQSPAKRQESATKGLEESKKNGSKAKNTGGDERKGANSNHDGKDTTTEQHEEETVEEKLKYTDQCTAFISNLSYLANDESLRSFFSDVGGVFSIWILKDRFTGKSSGLAYVDFADDDHLAAAIAKNMQSLMGKKLNIARPDPKKAKSKIPLAENGKSPNIQLKGKNTFAAPRAIARPQTVKPLGWTKPEPKANKGEEEKLKSNDEFRKMFIKSSDDLMYDANDESKIAQVILVHGTKLKDKG